MEKTPLEVLLSFAHLGGGVLDPKSLVEHSSQIELMAQAFIQNLNSHKVQFTAEDAKAFFQIAQKVQRMGGIHNLKKLLDILEKNEMLDSFANMSAEKDG